MATLLLFLGGCAPAPTAQASPSPRPSIQIATFERYAGAYRTSEGVTYVVNGHGHLLNLQDSSFRQLHPTSVADRFTIGRAFAVPSPKQADVIFQVAGARADQLTIKPASGPTVVAGRLLFKETEVRAPADGAVLAATITAPLTPAPHPGIVIVHASGTGPRIDYGIWVGLYASLGLTVLAYDKRGNGASTGTYPGEAASDRNLEIYAVDAAAMLRFLTSWPGIDPGRVHGGSQGGWVVPLAIGRHQAPAAFAVLVSGPAVTSEQQQVWADFSSDSTVVPTVPPAEMNAVIRATTTTAYVPATPAIDHSPAHALGQWVRRPPGAHNGQCRDPSRTPPSELGHRGSPRRRPRALRKPRRAGAGPTESDQARHGPARSAGCVARPNGWRVALDRRQSSVRLGARCRRTRPNGLRPSSAWMKR